jgi:two-component system, OmpR family, response regulator
MEENKFNILLAEDDNNLGNILKSYLEIKGYSVSLCVNGKEASTTFNKGKFDFCIVDVMMPLMDGFNLAKEIKKSDRNVPVIFLTAKSMQEDINRGLEIGADDYIVKPFSMEELLLRVKAILRRAYQTDDASERVITFKIGKATFDYQRQMLVFDKKENKLTSKESDLLRLLCENVNQVVDRTVALNKIWQSDSYFNARSMDVYITKLRKFLKDIPKVELQNVHGIGFKLVVQK